LVGTFDAVFLGFGFRDIGIEFHRKDSFLSQKLGADKAFPLRGRCPGGADEVETRNKKE